MSNARPRTIDRFAVTADLAPGARKIVGYSVIPAVVLALLGAGYLALSNAPGAEALAAIGVGTGLALLAWKNRGIGLPLFPMVVIQHLVVYGLPIAIRNESIQPYSDSLLRLAGFEVLVFLVALTLGWLAAMQVLAPGRPIAHALRIITLEGNSGLRRIGYSLIVFTSIYYVLQSLDLLTGVMGMLPSGAESVLNTLISVAALCGFFIIALEIGSGRTTLMNKVVFWAIFAVNCLITAAGLLLSSSAGFIAATFIGLFWGSQRIPWRFLVVVLSILAFLSVGKYEMRVRYWETTDEFIPFVPMREMPERYAEWAQTSWEALTRPGTTSTSQRETTEGSVFARINNLQNLLYVMDETQSRATPFLHGATYSLIPPLLIPRIFWPDKPRTHEGQVMLNVHFGRQDLISSFKTYIAWGLLPEAFGNFGPWAGSIILGLVVGWLCAWYEKVFAPKLVISLEGFVAFTIFLGVAGSFEMVASVLVTSIFQGVMVVVIACLPFVHKQHVRRPDARQSR